MRSLNFSFFANLCFVKKALNIEIDYWWDIVKSNIDKLIFIKNNTNNDNKSVDSNFEIEKNINKYYANNDF